MNSEYKRFIESKAKECQSIDSFPPELYEKFDVKKGLRDNKGNGVVVGLTSISQVDGTEKIDGKKVPCEGKLRYRGYDIEDLTQGFLNKRFGFEECTYLLLFGNLPTQDELEEFKMHLAEERRLPVTFTRDVIMKAANKDIMNSVSTATTPTTTTSTTRACTSTGRTPSCPRRRTYSACSGPTSPTPTSRPPSSTWRSSCTWSTAEATTPPSPPA